MIYTVLGEDGGVSPPSARAQNQNPSCNQGNVRCSCDLMLSRTVRPWNLKPDLCMTKEYFTQLLQWWEYISSSGDEKGAPPPPPRPILPLRLCSRSHADAIPTPSSTAYQAGIKDISGTLTLEGRTVESAAHCWGQHYSLTPVHVLVYKSAR